MPIFVSYSHQNREFATRLAAQLVKHRARVWIDQWELHVGDSLIDRIQAAIEGASALIIVLSRAAVESEWCKKELSSGLLRELEEKRVVVLPVLMEDCDIPLFVRPKKYPAFRTDFDGGLKDVLEAIARITSDTLGRIDEPEWHVDWSLDWGMLDDSFFILITMVEQAHDQPYSCLTQIRIIANERATTRYLAFAENDLDWVERGAIIEMLADGTHDKDLRVLLEDEKEKTVEVTMADRALGTVFQVLISARRLGEDTGRDILLDLGGQLRRAREAQRQSLRPLTPEELATMKRIKASLVERAV